MHEKLKTIIKMKGLTINKVALLADITPSDLYNALSGKRPLYPGWRKRIAEVLGVDESELIEKE